MRIPGVRQKVGGIPVTRTAGKYCSGGAPFQTHTRAHTQSDALTHTYTRAHARTLRTQNPSPAAAGLVLWSLVSDSASTGQVNHCRESLRGSPLVSFSSKSPYEYFTRVSASTSQ